MPLQSFAKCLEEKVGVSMSFLIAWTTLRNRSILRATGNPSLLPRTHFDSVDDPEDTILYSVKERASASAWAKMRSFLRNTVVECSAMPSDQSCIKCPEAAVYRCLQCGSCVYYCHDCFGRAHSVTNIFHTGEVWEVNVVSLYMCLNKIIYTTETQLNMPHAG